VHGGLSRLRPSLRRSAQIRGRISLARAGVDGMTVTEVRSYERSNGHTQQYRSAEHKIHLVAKLKVEIIVEDGRVPALLDDAVRIRTNERGRDAL